MPPSGASPTWIPESAPCLRQPAPCRLRSGHAALWRTAGEFGAPPRNRRAADGRASDPGGQPAWRGGGCYRGALSRKCLDEQLGNAVALSAAHHEHGVAR